MPAKAPTTALACMSVALAMLTVCQAVSQGQWSTQTLSASRYLCAATSVRDQVIFAGGSSGSIQQNRIDRYSALTDTWTQESLSIARSWLSAASLSWPAPSTSGFVMIAGGALSTAASARIDIFNAQSLTWSVSPVSLSVARFAMAATSLDTLSLIFFAGGREVASVSNTVYATVDVFKLSSSGSVTASILNMSVPRHGLSATSLPQQSVAIFAGGMTSAGSSSKVADIYNAATQEWTVASLSVARAYMGATTLATYSSVFFAGGWVGSNSVGNCSKVVDIYNGITKTWTQATLSIARMHLAAAALDLQGIVVFAGGLKLASSIFTGQYSDDVDIFTASTGSWSVHTLTAARSFLVPAVLPLRGLMYLGGGFVGGSASVSNIVDVWDVRTDSLGPVSPSITLSNPARGGTGISMTVAVIPASPIPVNGKIVITLPGNFNCSTGTNVLFSPPGTPLRTGSVSIDGSVMTIALLSGSFPGGSSFTMTFAGVTNPSEPQAFSSAVNGAALNENGLTIGSSSIGTLVAIVPNLGPASPSISLSSVLASQTKVIMTVTLVPECSIPSTGRLLITLSGSGWNLPASTPVLFASSASGTAASASLALSSDATVLSVQFSAGKFPANERVTFRIDGFTNTPVAQTTTPNVNDPSPRNLQIASAVTDVSSVVTCASVDGSMPAIIDKFGCDEGYYFVEAVSACQACNSDYTVPRGSIGGGCKYKQWVEVVYGVCICIAVVLIILSILHWHIKKQKQRREEEDRIRMENRQHPLLKNLQLPDVSRKADLLRETAEAGWTGDPTKGDSTPSNLKLLDVNPTSLFYQFVLSKMRPNPYAFPTTMNISRIQMVRLPREGAFCSDIKRESSTAQVLPRHLIPVKPDAFQPGHDEFQAGLDYFNSKCEPTLSVSATDNWDNAQVVFAWHGSRPDNIESLCQNGPRSYRLTDGGFFGSGSYLALECAYASRYSEAPYPDVYPDYDPNAGQPHPQAGELITNDRGELGVIMFACYLSPFPYVITLTRDYHGPRCAQHPGFSSFYSDDKEQSKDLMPKYNAHFVPVKFYGLNNPLTGRPVLKPDGTPTGKDFDYQACPETSNPQGHELVIDHYDHTLPVAVLWYKK